MPFVKGQSGNPAGRPVGSRNRFTRDLDEAFQKDGFAVIDTIMAYAQNANPAAMRLCFDRLMGKHRPCAVELPLPDAPDYTVTALTEIHRALGAGEIASDEAARLVDFVGRTARVLASKAAAEIDVAERLARCEKALLLLLGADKAIDNNNAESMAPERAAAAPAPPAEAPAPGKISENTSVGDAPAAPWSPPIGRLRLNGATIERLMGSTSLLAHTAGPVEQKSVPAARARAMPPESRAA
jgi:Family of unknown function (DUF5681)